MKKLIVLSLAIVLFACGGKEEKKKPLNDYVTITGTVSNKKSDTLYISNRGFAKAIPVAADGTFKDTLKLTTPNIYYLNNKERAALVYLKNGFELDVKLDEEDFGENLVYSGLGAEENNYLLAKNKFEEDLFEEDLDGLDETQLNTKITEMKEKTLAFIEANQKGLDSTLIAMNRSEVAPSMESMKSYYLGKIALRKELPKGKKSPIFENYENYAGGTLSLADLKGKNVYVDVWATWCGPCKVEIPSLKKLEHDYEGKNIAFVSMSIDDDRSHKGSWELAREDWKAMVADKELGGLQIMAPKGWKSQFVQDYKINGIPRFILIDTEGKIINADAPRPSSDNIRTLLDEIIS